METVERVTLACVTVLSEKREWCVWVTSSNQEGGEKESGKGAEEFVTALHSHLSSDIEIHTKVEGRHLLRDACI